MEYSLPEPIEKLTVISYALQVSARVCLLGIGDK